MFEYLTSDGGSIYGAMTPKEYYDYVNNRGCRPGDERIARKINDNPSKKEADLEWHRNNREELVKQKILPTGALPPVEEV